MGAHVNEDLSQRYTHSS